MTKIVIQNYGGVRRYYEGAGRYYEGACQKSPSYKRPYSMSIAYHPNIHGQIKVLNRTLEKYLPCFNVEQPKT